MVKCTRSYSARTLACFRPWIIRPYNPTEPFFNYAYWIRSCIYNYTKELPIVRLGSTRHGESYLTISEKNVNILSHKASAQHQGTLESAIPEDEIIIFSQHFTSPALSLDSQTSADDQRTLERTVASKNTKTPELWYPNLNLVHFYENTWTDLQHTPRWSRHTIWKNRLMADPDDKTYKSSGKHSMYPKRIKSVEAEWKPDFDYLQDKLGDEIDFDFS